MSPALAAMVAAALSGPPLPAPVDLSPAQLAGQRVAFAYEGFRPPRALVRRIEQGRAAGVILFRRNIRSSAQLRQTMGGLQRAARRSALELPLLVMVDQEGGRVRRLPGGPERSAAGVRSARDALADGRAAGRALRAGGVNVDLAPVADVCRRGGALEGERRCYGRSPSAVTSRAGAFARGLRQRGVAPALKHFPGFGAARVNTDFAPATIRASRRRLRSFDGQPFAALHRRASLVMLSTAVYPALSRRPAAISSTIATGELRHRLGFRGVSVADALDRPSRATAGPGRWRSRRRGPAPTWCSSPAPSPRATGRRERSNARCGQAGCAAAPSSARSAGCSPCATAYKARPRSCVTPGPRPGSWPRGVNPPLRRLHRNMSGKVATRTLEAALLALAGSQHRVVGRVQLRELGLSDDQTDWRMERGWLRRLYRGVYQVGPGALTREGHWMAATLAVGHRGALSHRSAAELWGLIAGCSSPVHVTAPGTGGRSRRSGLIVHRFTAPTETIIKRRILVSTPPRTIIDLAEVVDRRTLERALDEAERLRVCTEAQLRRAIERHPGRSGAAKLRAVLEGHAVGNTATENDFEELMLALCDENAIPRPRCQLPLGDYHPDFAWPEHGVIVETDGRATHGTRKAFEADRARDAELTTAGWRVLRFTWRHLTERPEWVARKVKDALGVLPHGR